MRIGTLGKESEGMQPIFQSSAHMVIDTIVLLKIWSQRGIMLVRWCGWRVRRSSLHRYMQTAKSQSTLCSTINCVWIIATSMNLSSRNPALCAATQRKHISKVSVECHKLFTQFMFQSSHDAECRLPVTIDLKSKCGARCAVDCHNVSR